MVLAALIFVAIVLNKLLCRSNRPAQVGQANT